MDNAPDGAGEPVPEEPARGSTRLFQIYEDDLADLERILPQLADRLMTQLDVKARAQIRRVKEIIGNVRWNYGPPDQVIVIPAE